MVVITSNGLSSDKLLYDLFPHTQHLSSAVIVKTASNPVPSDDESLPLLEKELNMLRLSVDWFDFDTDSPTDLLRYDVVEMSGGDPFYLRKSIADAKAEPVLRQIAKEKILIGVSAGAIVQQKNMCLIAQFIAETGRKPQDELCGIGIVDHEIMPHYKQFCARYFHVEERIRQYELETGRKVIRLSDGEGFLTDNINAIGVKKMLHQMRLNHEPFEQIKNGSKTIELRLNDEKRQKVQVGDFIEFTCLEDSKQIIQTRVTALHRFDSFAELYAALPKEKLGYSSSETPEPSHMDAYYSREKQEQYGALGIELYCTDLQRFIDAQNHGYGFGETYATALSEMEHGYKISHWIWYIFPQICGLGRSGTTAYFSIKDLSEAADYYAHPILGARLVEICEVLLKIESDDPMSVFGFPDAFKVRSCMTLFKHAAPEQPVFQQVLDKFCRGIEDEKTLKILGI